jgi:hypothetical protein
MRIFYRASGGFAGLIREAKVDIKDLGLKEANVLREVVADALKLPPNISHNTAARDQAEIEININAPDGMVNLSFDAIAVPNEVKPLIAFMKARAKPARPD